MAPPQLYHPRLEEQKSERSAPQSALVSAPKGPCGMTGNNDIDDDSATQHSYSHKFPEPKDKIHSITSVGVACSITGSGSVQVTSGGGATYSITGTGGSRKSAIEVVILGRTMGSVRRRCGSGRGASRCKQWRVVLAALRVNLIIQ